MALRTTPTIIICLTAALASGVALARPGDPAGSADSRYESTDADGAGADPIDLSYGGPPPAAGTDDGSADGDIAITIEDFDFSGRTAVAPGTEIAVTNRDGAIHTLTSSDGLFDTDRLAQDATGTIVAPDEPGDYEFFCQIHPSMRGTLTVG